MILAAGLGTRLKPFTDHHPKALAQVNGKTLLQRNIEYLASFGIQDIIINVHHFPDQIKEHLRINKNFGIRVSISDESEEVLETGGGLMKAGWFFEDSPEPFVLMNVDVLTDMNLQNMIDQHLKEKPLATLAVSQRNTSRYLLFDEQNRLCGWKNEKSGQQRISREMSEFRPRAFSGIQVLSPQIFGLVKQRGKFSLIDVYLELAKTKIISSYDHSHTKFIDAGKPESIARAEKLFD